MADQPVDPSAKKGIIFALFPFIPCLFILAIALIQNKAFPQNANAYTGNNRADLKACYKLLSLSDRGLDQLTEKQTNDTLFDCREELKRKEAAKNG